MNNNIRKQEKTEEIYYLRKILHKVHVAEKSDYEWAVIEDNLFSAIETQNNSLFTIIKNTLTRYFPDSIAHPVFAYSMSLFLICLGLFYYFAKSNEYHIPSAFIEINSFTVAEAHKNTTIQHISNTAKPSLKQFQIISTSDTTTALLLLDSNVQILLDKNSTITLKKLQKKALHVYLNSGSLTASVQKRKQMQNILFSTPHMQCAILGTFFKLDVLPEDNSSKLISTLSVLEGRIKTISIKNHLYSSLVESGQSLCYNANDQFELIDMPNDFIPTKSIQLLTQTRLFNKKSSVAARGIIDFSCNLENATLFVNDSCIGTAPCIFTYPHGKYAISISDGDSTIWSDNVVVKSNHLTTIETNFPQELYFAEHLISKNTANTSIQTTNPLLSYDLSDTTLDQNKKVLIKDFSFIKNTAFVEALMYMSTGEYQKALTILDSLKELPQISITDKIRLMSKMAACYKGMGNFQVTLQNLEQRFNASNDTIEKSNILWEIITVKSNCLEDYEGAEQDIKLYIDFYPDGSWIESAYIKLGEIQYIRGKYSEAVNTFTYHISFFRSGKLVEQSLYTIANILRLDTKQYSQAARWYGKLITQFPSTLFLENALFERAECFEKIDRKQLAMREYQIYLKKFPAGYLRYLCIKKLTTLTQLYQ